MDAEAGDEAGASPKQPSPREQPKDASKSNTNEGASATEVSVSEGEQVEERQLIERKVVRVQAAWLKKKKGNPDLNPRGFQVICTLSGREPPPAPGKKASFEPKPPPLIKDFREPPAKSIAFDVKELPDAYMFVGDVPGMKSTDIKIEVVNDRFMTIACGRSRNAEPDASYISLERSMGQFLRKFQLPANANLDAMKAGCEDGILTIFVPMSPPADEHVPKSFDVALDGDKRRK